MKVAVIGGGTMGGALVKSILRARLAAKGDIIVSDVSRERRELARKKYGVAVGDDNAAAVKGVDAVILAIKPQEMDGVMEQISAHLKSQLVISIAAGVSLETICRRLKYGAVVRAMPNTPAQVGRGMTVWTSSKELSAEKYDTARLILSSMGEELHFADERYLDMATAISGSGPAYVFLFIEALIDAGVHIGLPRDTAQKLVIETVAGSAEAMKKMSKHPAELRNMVTSPGGTTSEALLRLESGGLRSLVVNAVTAAYEKAKSIGAKQQG
ncbi:MAG: pyrroline-5-carboxylate reductase [Chloroflexi bacterium]|nr:pyrroline-5-carboxylate reductase [Chloroflexota bacterium]